MGVKGVAHAQAVEVELDPFLRTLRRHVRIHRLGALEREPVLPGEMLGCRPGPHARRGRVELEAPPGDLEAVTLGKARERLLEATLPHVAPRARYVGPDFQLHRRNLCC